VRAPRKKKGTVRAVLCRTLTQNKKRERQARGGARMRARGKDRDLNTATFSLQGSPRHAGKGRLHTWSE